MSDLVARLRLEATSGNVPAVAAQTKAEMASIGEAARSAGASSSTAAAGADQLADALGRTAEASRSAGTAAAEAAGRALEQAQAEAAVTAGAGALAESREAIAASEGVLTAAHEAAAQAAEAAGAATDGLTDALDGAEKASTGASRGMGALLSMINPAQIALAAVGGAIWVVNDALATKKARAEAATEADAALSRVLILNAAHAEAAAIGARNFGKENAGAVSGTNALAVATRALAAETRVLANAKAEEARQTYLAAIAASQAREADLQPNWFERGGQMLARGARASGQIGLAGVLDGLYPSTDGQQATEKAVQRQNMLALLRLVGDPASDKPEATGGGGSSGGGSTTDRPGEMLAGLKLEEAALIAHAEAAMRGGAALDAWRVADAGAQAVAAAGLAATDAAAAGVRARAEAVERLMIADERISQAAAFARGADRDREALERRAVAAMQGERALEDLRVVEAGLAVLAEARVTSLDQLTGKEREAVALAVQSAEAKERQAIATARAEAAGKSIEALGREIDAEVRRAAAIGRGIAATVEYARAEYIRSEIERAGLKITDEAAAGIRAKAEALFSLRAATEGLETADVQERELRLARLTNREREIAVRAEAEAARLMREHVELSEQAALAQADRAARAQVEAEETASAIGRISASMREAFIRDGRLAFDDLETYAAERLRQAVYDAFLAKPIDILINATVEGIGDLAKQLFGGSAAQGFITRLMGSTSLKAVAGNAGVGAAIGGALGLGSGNGLADIGLSMGGSYLGGLAGSALTSYAANSSLMMLAGSAGAPLAGLAGALAPVMGPLGALAGMALGSLLKDEKRPYTRADIVAQGGSWTVAGTEAADGAAKDIADRLGKAITESLNAASSLFGIDVAKLEGLYTTAGYVTGGNYKALGGEGYFGGDIRGLIDYYSQAGSDKKGNTLGAGVSFSQVGDAEALATQVVKETILRAIAAGASDLSAAEIQLVQAASSLEEAVALIQSGRSLGQTIDDLMLQLLDPAAFEKKKALEAVEATYQALRSEAEALIEAGLATADILDKIEQLKALQIDSVLNGLTGGGNVFAAARDGLLGWLDRLQLSNLSPLGVVDQRAEAEDQFRRMLALAQGGDAGALGEIAGYAERLLEADRAATGSAQRRMALFEEVTGAVRALAEQTGPVEPLTATAISGPIVAALQGSDTAMAALLLSLPADTAGPILEAILREPDWAVTLLGQNAYVPLALTDLAAAVSATPAGTSSPIVAALMQTPEWAMAANGYLGALPPSLDNLAALLAGQPASVAGPVVAALMATPTWAATTVTYLGALEPSLTVLQGLTAALPAETAGPIIAALAATPGWAPVVTSHLAGIAPSLELLRAVLAVAPSETAALIVQALTVAPPWAGALQGWLQAGQTDMAAAIRELLAWLAGGEARPQPGVVTPVPEIPISPIIVEPILPDLHLPMPDWVPPLLNVGQGGLGGGDLVDAIHNLVGAVNDQGRQQSDAADAQIALAREQLDQLLDMVREARLSNVRRSLVVD